MVNCIQNTDNYSLYENVGLIIFLQIFPDFVHFIGLCQSINLPHFSFGERRSKKPLQVVCRPFVRQSKMKLPITSKTFLKRYD